MITTLYIVGEVNKIKEAVANFENTNGTRMKDITTKQLVLILHKQLSEKIDKHVEWGEKVSKALADHDVLFQKITDTLPEKGFCEKVSNILWPQPPELPLDQKVNIIWHDRRWLKIIFTTIVAVGGINILMQVI